MPILNYTTSIASEKSVMEIQAKLAKAKATAILSEYDTEGVLSHLSFKVNTPHGLMAFRLPANVDGVYRSLIKSNAAKKLKTKEQAARVAWRIVKTWIEAQLAIIDAEMATLDQIFLPYAQTSNGKTVYEQFEQHGLLMLENN